MWHLKTKLGTFWIVEHDVASEEKYYLGFEDQTLGDYDAVERAVQDVCEQSTGVLKWDESTRVSAPDKLLYWEQGEPDMWDK